MSARKTYQEWTPEHVAELRERCERGESSKEIATAMQRPIASINGKCQAEGIERTFYRGHKPAPPTDWKKRAIEAERRCDSLLADLERERNRKAVKFRRAAKRTRKRGSMRVTIGDTHGMRVDHAAFAAFLDDLAILKPNSAIHGGDIVDCDGFLSRHPPVGYKALSPYSYDEDIEAANTQLDAIAKASPKTAWEIIEGNHDMRPLNWVLEATDNERDRERLRRQNYAPYVLSLEARGIPYHSRGHQHDDINKLGTIKRGKCYYVHGDSHAKRAAEAHLIKFASNVVFFHTHRAEEIRLKTVATGVVGAWNAGCLCQLLPMYGHSKPNDWSHGYGLEFAEPGGDFLHINVPIIEGRSLLRPMLNSLGIKP